MRSRKSSKGSRNSDLKANNSWQKPQPSAKIQASVTGFWANSMNWRKPEDSLRVNLRFIEQMIQNCWHKNGLKPERPSKPPIDGPTMFSPSSPIARAIFQLTAASSMNSFRFPTTSTTFKRNKGALFTKVHCSGAVSFNLLLQLKDSVKKGLRSGRTSGNVNIHRNDPIASPHHGIGIMVITTPVSATTHTDYPTWFRHLVIHFSQSRCHFICKCPRYNHNITLSR